MLLFFGALNQFLTCGRDGIRYPDSLDGDFVALVVGKESYTFY